MIVNRQREVRIARPGLESFLRRVKRELGLGNREVTVCLVGDAEMARLNGTFRKKKGPTDVLSFPASERAVRLRLGRGASRSLSEELGEIAIAPATARRYAKKQGKKLAEELRVLILHGVLHLLGFDHETDHGKMDKLEQKLRKRLGIA